MSFTFSPGVLKNEILDIYQNEYSTYKAQVAARWPGDVVTLEDFREYKIGEFNQPGEIKNWPTLAVLNGDVVRHMVAEQNRTIFWQTQIYLRIYLRNSNTTTLEKMLDRHIEASLLMFEADQNRTLNGKAMSFEFMRAEPTQSILPLGASIYIKGLEIQWEARHR